MSPISLACGRALHISKAQLAASAPLSPIPASAGSPDGFQYDAAPHRNTALCAQPDQRQESSFKGLEITFKTNIN